MDELYRGHLAPQPPSATNITRSIHPDAAHLPEEVVDLNARNHNYRVIASNDNAHSPSPGSGASFAANMAPPPPPPPPEVTVNINTDDHPHRSQRGGWFWMRWPKPHPLLWIILAISVLALVLEVPKGSLPTFSGRHKALRAQEKVVQEKLQLLTKLSTFLPPPLAALVAPFDPANPTATSLLALPDYHQLELLRLAPTLRFWNTGLAQPFGVGVGNDGQQWWSVEQLGEGASVVRSKGEGQDREVWVLRIPGELNEETPQTAALTQALTHSLLLRGHLSTEIHQLKSTPCPVCPAPPPPQLNHQYSPSGRRSAEHEYLVVVEEEEFEAARQRDEWEKYEEKRRRDKEREKEVEEREREVARREKWVVEEMRKMSDKIQQV
ncbi:hypothetical protein L202_02443 [Cryptococcus amylolentus CBS 6039]|uniref:Uncharacterized protein n=1 Tax=Cryptococcus amylolentus CBS 6039 TaxID=1295533 RepID=A0A1E3I0L4_9TREE|nr:hypothetical protein L202_02443 [Cryptococcus amylolentus CBS 6039]ODN82143.1 hypothetical protein L202_02443 [Cryptococcus amylolentus CBS 6039]